MSHLNNRYDFVVIFEVNKGNPNGDPDAGNLPRIDPETNRGLVSDVSLKRKIRNYVELAKKDEAKYRIYVREGSILNETHREAYIATRPNEKNEGKLNPKSDEEMKELQKFMFDNFFDIRTFGAVMSTGVNCGQVRGPVQFSFAESVEAIVPQEITITRMAATNEAEKKAQSEGADDNNRTENRTMGRKSIVPYGLYRAHGFVSAKLSEKTSFDEQDIEVLFAAIENMFEHDHSAARGEMSVRGFKIFKHSNALGNAPAHKLFDAVKVGRNIDGEYREIGDPAIDNRPPARKFEDYIVKIEKDKIPEGIELIERV